LRGIFAQNASLEIEKHSRKILLDFRGNLKNRPLPFKSKKCIHIVL
jgi:hypothetical protein